MSANMKAMYIVLKAHEIKCLDAAVKLLTSLAKQQKTLIRGPIPLPVSMKRWTVNRSVHIDKTSREQFERAIHSRLFCVQATPSFIESISQVILPSGVMVKIIWGGKK